MCSYFSDKLSVKKQVSKSVNQYNPKQTRHLPKIKTTNESDSQIIITFANEKNGYNVQWNKDYKSPVIFVPNNTNNRTNNLTMLNRRYNKTRLIQDEANKIVKTFIYTPIELFQNHVTTQVRWCYDTIIFNVMSDLINSDPQTKTQYGGNDHQVPLAHNKIYALEHGINTEQYLECFNTTKQTLKNMYNAIKDKLYKIDNMCVTTENIEITENAFSENTEEEIHVKRILDGKDRIDDLISIITSDEHFRSDDRFKFFKQHLCSLFNLTEKEFGMLFVMMLIGAIDGARAVRRFINHIFNFKQDIYGDVKLVKATNNNKRVLKDTIFKISAVYNPDNTPQLSLPDYIVDDLSHAGKIKLYSKAIDSLLSRFISKDIDIAADVVLGLSKLANITHTNNELSTLKGDTYKILGENNTVQNITLD